ncbi:DNA repair protein RecO [bacterium CG_4_10_14_0_2_um_filter_33_32]|nr:MAG: DNA repair protein RecO [bacterium CG2_30_33_46]PIR67500.1 MAG: DNA repair protein RecO [bacterium CG10_big_fil_rev_8_21_14_0_10_33_18]PIU77018.1 MAG: DNA repair protein RecO [bacterium CG06_land_8_20_14_3_00_33_50]PIW81745.1 MAG: DNA repair protein RecO [bacterium CG_4_8_14_3_um_filter_33_28]PIY85825.1 MAG: DNA repair protein RecO [bacterium CG_4_10_14_0_8_um_filter_33_57]PIZ85464.1 MAG: DNA repair protein RecO [bacterium CG_4_10_14_0_2_um_filter_33_32]PJA72039.1 MAG: DNA repair prot
MNRYSDVAIVLKRKSFGEADNLITVFSKNHGKIKLLAKGSRKIKSKFMGHIEPLCLIKLSAVSGKSFEILTSSQIEESHHELKSNLKNLPLINLICEITDAVTCERLSNYQVFNLITRVFSSGLWGNKPELISLFYFINLLKFLGFAPNFHNCVKCDKNGIIFPYFSYYWGGVVCQDCIDSYPGKRIDEETVMILKLVNSSTNKIFSIVDRLHDKDTKKSFKIISDFFIYIIEKKPLSLKCVEEHIY